MIKYSIFVLLTILGIGCETSEPSKGPAIAFPVSGVTVDGDFTDWPVGVTSFSIDEIYSEKTTPPDDFEATFRVGHNLDEKCIYVALAVTDDEHVPTDSVNNSVGDAVLLYLDLAHSYYGSSPIYLVAGEGQRDLFRRSPDLDRANQIISWDNAEVSIKRVGEQTNYEWRIYIDDHLQLGKPIGLDFLIDDIDPGENESATILWTEGFSKSINSIALGDVLPISAKNELGKIAGSVKTDAEVLSIVKRLRITSVENGDLWVQTTVDSTGRFEAYLPFGKYKIEPTYRFTSEKFASIFNQNSRRIKLKEPVLFSIGSRKTQIIEDLRLQIVEYTEELFEEAGVLLQEDVDIPSIQSFIKQTQAYFEIPGISVAQIKEGELIYKDATGIKSTTSRESLDDETLFEAASISKAVFATIVLRLVERGVIDLDRPLLQYLPFPNIEKDERSKLLTGRMILNHQSGLPNWAWFPPPGWKTGGDLQLLFEPGTDDLYSGEAMNYLGRVVSHLTGKSVSQLFAEEVAAPFGLKNTHFTYDRSLQNISLGHFNSFPRIHKRLDVDSPASSVLTEAGDFSNFVIGLMNYENLSSDSYASIMNPGKYLDAEDKLYDPDLPQGFGNGFNVQESVEGKLIGHGGNNDDFDCKFSYFPDTKTGYIVFTNSNMGDEFIRMLELYLFRGSGAIKEE